MKNWIVRRVIAFCCKRALKHHQMLEMLKKQEDLVYLYTHGINAFERDKWLDRIKKLQDFIRK